MDGKPRKSKLVVSIEYECDGRRVSDVLYFDAAIADTVFGIVHPQAVQLAVKAKLGKLSLVEQKESTS